MRKRLLAVTLSVMMTASMLAGCGGKADTKDTKKVQTEQDSSKAEGIAEESSEEKCSRRCRTGRWCIYCRISYRQFDVSCK